jgi:hypothetical protein
VWCGEVRLKPDTTSRSGSSRTPRQGPAQAGHHVVFACPCRRANT